MNFRTNPTLTGCRPAAGVPEGGPEQGPHVSECWALLQPGADSPRPRQRGRRQPQDGGV